MSIAESDKDDLYKMYEIDEETLAMIADALWNTRGGEYDIPCEGCGKFVKYKDDTPEGCVRLGIPHVYCSECIRKILARQATDA